MRDFDGKAALITGGALGIGRGIARAFAAEGARVAIADVNADAAEALAAELRATGADVVPVVGDVSLATDAARMVAETVEQLGRLDVLVNNAGIQPTDWYFRLEDMPEEVWDRILAVNLKGAFLMSKYALPRIRETGRGGVIVNMSSVQGLQSMPGVPAYAASKGGIVSMSRGLARSLAPHGITVNSVSPGAADTAMMRSGMTDEGLAKFVEMIPLGRMAEPSEVASTVLFLASDLAGYVTGATLNVSGGQLMY